MSYHVDKLQAQNWVKSDFEVKFYFEGQGQCLPPPPKKKKKKEGGGGRDSCDRPNNLAKIWSKSSIFQPMSPWNLMDDIEK